MTQKITMGRDKRQDKIDAMNAMRQSGGNPFVSGIGTGNLVAATRNHYGAPTTMPQEVADPKGNFSQEDSPANAPFDDSANQTGDLALGSSETQTPDQDQRDLNTDKLERRLAMYKVAGSNAFSGNNDRSQMGVA